LVPHSKVGADRSWSRCRNRAGSSTVSTSDGEDRNQGRATGTPAPRIRLAAALPMQIRHQQMVTGGFRSVPLAKQRRSASGAGV